MIANCPLERAFQNSARAKLDGRIARIFYTDWLPFHFAKSPNYQKSYAYVATHNILGYVPPGYNALRTTLLHKKRKKQRKKKKKRVNVERLLKPIKDSRACKWCKYNF